jgi:serine/threonine protein kinase
MAGDDDSHTNIDEMQMARSAPVELRRGTVLAGRYEIEATLGCGGAGLVLRAQDRELREAVAIKVLRPDLGNAARWIDRLAREVKLARQLRHPNVCRVFDFEKAEGHVFIVMELAKGGSLRHELDDGTLLARPLEARLADARAVAAGLAAIHDAGIAHRDVTPQNVLRMDDGRVVVSDFGLATEISQTTTSIHGGTIAYMAPEVVRGQRGSFASDVWALGVVIHEIVFGERPTWSKPVGGTLVAPGGGRTLTRGERVAFGVCRACTAEEVDRRPKSAEEVGAWLDGRPTARKSRRRGWKVLGWLTLAGIAGLAMHLSSKRPRTRADMSGFVELPDRPTDWTDSSQILATISDRVQCMSLLPDRQTIRFVWGHPTRSEDLDLRTGRRTASPLAPEVYRLGCADVSADGKHLAFQGYAPDGRAFAFISERPDGRNAVPIVAIADPTMSSEPKWLPDGRAFTFDIDHQHMGVFSLDTNRTTVLPDATAEAYHSSTRFVIGARIFVASAEGTPYQSDFIALSWPLLTEQARFNIPDLALDVASRGGDVLFVTTAALRATGQLWRVDLEGRTRTRLAVIPDQSFRYPLLTDANLIFVSQKRKNDIWLPGSDERLAQLTRSGDVVSASACGADLIVLRTTRDSLEVVRMDRSGRVQATLASNMAVIDPVCSPDGREWYFARVGEATGIYRCGLHPCKLILADSANSLAVSPDGERLAFIRVRKTEPVVAWVSTKGSDVHEVGASETSCPTGWSSNRGLWVSHLRGGHPSWVEVDAETLQETGRTVKGGKDCSDGIPDPASPVSSDLRVIRQVTAQIRTVPIGMLTR